MCPHSVKLPTYKKNRFELDSGESRHEETPDTFWLPARSLRENLQPGELVKLIFRMEDKSGPDALSVERMWVEVTEIISNGYVGKLDNDPGGGVYIQCGEVVCFSAEHVIEIYDETDT